MKKVLTITILSVAGLLVLAFLILNLSFTRQYATRQVNHILHQSGLPIEVGSLRKVLPNVVEVQGVSLSGPEGDTLIRAGQVHAGIRLLSLLRKRVVIKDTYIHGAEVHLIRDPVSGAFSIATAFPQGEKKNPDREKADWSVHIRSLALEQLRFRMSDSLSGIHLDAGALKLELSRFKLAIVEQNIRLHSLDVQDLAGSLRMESGRAPKKESTGDPWNMGIDRARLADTRLKFEQPGQGLWLETLLGELTLNMREMDLAGPAIEMERLRVGDTEFRMRSPVFHQGNRLAVLIPMPDSDSLLALTGIELDLRNALWRDGVARGVLKTLRAETRPGVILGSLEGSLDSGEERTHLELLVQVLNSQIELKGSAAGSMDKLLSDLKDPGDVMLTIVESRIMPPDLTAFLPFFDSIPPDLLQHNSPVLINGDLELRNDTLHVPGLQIHQKDGIQLDLQGDIEQPLTPPGIIAEVRASVRSPLGKALAEGAVNIPADSFFLQGSFSRLSTVLLMEEEGPDMIYGTAKVRGTGRTRDSLNAQFELLIDSMQYSSLALSDLGITGRYTPHEITGTLRSGDPAIGGLLDASLIPGDSVLRILSAGWVKARLDLLGITGDSLSLLTHLKAGLSLFGDSLASQVNASEFRLEGHGESHDIGAFSAGFHTGPDRTTGQVQSGVLDLDAELSTAFSGLGKLRDDLGDYFRGIRDTSGLLSTNRLSRLPEIRVNALLREHLLVQQLAGDTGISFNDLQLAVEHRTQQSKLSVRIQGDKLAYGGIRADRLNGLLSDSAAELRLNLEALNASLGSGPGFRLKAEGSYANGTANAGLGVFESNDEKVYGIDLKGTLVNRILELQLASNQVILNHTPWEANEPGFLTMDLVSKQVHPNLRLRSGPSELSFRSLPSPDSGTFRLTMKQIGLNKLWHPALIQGRPSGELNGEVDLRILPEDRTRVEGTIYILEPEYAGLHFDSILIAGEMASNGEGVMESALQVRMDSSLLDVTSTRGLDDEMEAAATFQRLPLKTIESFASRHVRKLSGEVSGDFRFRTIAGELDLEGELGFMDAGVTVNALNAPFTIPDQQLRLVDDQIIFEDFRVLDTLNKALSVNGTIGIGKGKNPIADLEVRSDQLKLMSRDPDSKSPFTGNIFLDSRFSVSGPLSNPNVEGKILLSKGSEIYFQLLEEYQLSEREQIVDFSFVEPERPDSSLLLTTHHSEFIKSSVETMVDIDPSTLLNFRVDRRIYDLEMNIIGGGSIAYTLLDNNRSTLSGRYEIAEGEALLKLTGWPNKEFTISQGGYVRWDGRVDDPELKIEAVNSVRTSYLNPVDGKIMEADFNVTLSMSDYLSELDVRFDVQTPDQYIMRVLNTLSPEEQMQQAVSILLFETIDLPGISSSTDYMTQQVNQIVSSQLNQLTRTSIKGIDISLGLDTYNEPLPGGGTNTNTNLTYEVRKSMLNDRAQFQLKGRISDVDRQPGASDVSLHDLSFEYQLDSAASNYLKVYNRQSYDDVFEGEVIKTGIGYSYRKRYERLSDIFRRKNEKDQP